METRRSVSKSSMVIAGRGARACDMCAKERARWYCSADEVHLCERCDKTVHTANLVAKRHERVRLGSNGVPMKIGRKRDDPSGRRDRTLASKKWYHSSKKRSISADSRGSSGAGALHTLADVSTPLTGEACILVDAKPICPAQEEAFLLLPPNHITESLVKPEPFTPTNDHLSANAALTDLFDITSEESELMDEVPTYEPFLRELIAASHGDLVEEGLPSSHSPRRNTTTGWRDEEVGGGKLENSPDSSNEPASEVITGLIEDGSISINELSEIDEFDVMDLCASSKLEGESIDEGQDCPGTETWRSALDCTDTQAACSLHGGNPFKWKGERQLVAQQLQMSRVKSELAEDAMLDVETDWNKEHDRQTRHEDRPALAKTLSLRLDYEEVLSAWSDRGSLWMDGQRPQIVPGDSFLDPGSMDAWLHRQSSHAGEQACQVPVLDRRGDAGRAREARVMRYKEKRQTRLFTKKIRYEVRKLNADLRPRIKGRFVKRSTILAV